MGLTIGVDVGGTKVAAGVVDDEGRVLARVLRTTPSLDPQQIEDVIADVVTELSREHAIEAVGIGAAGFIDADRATVLFAPNLAWRDEPLRDEVAKRIGLPVVVENDANAAAWAEYRFGAGRGEPELVVITVGTGIGAGIVVDGGLYRGRFGIAGEMGHMEAVRDGRPCGCGKRGCWEQYASGRAVVHEARDIATAIPERAQRLLALGDGSPGGIDGPQITEAAKAGDPLCIEVFSVVGQWLGRGLANIALTLDPGCFVIGGGASAAGDLLLGPARTAFLDRLPGAEHRPHASITLAELGNDAGLVGAADLARAAT
jgi:glucokinase